MTQWKSSEKGEETKKVARKSQTETIYTKNEDNLKDSRREEKKHRYTEKVQKVGQNKAK